MSGWATQGVREHGAGRNIWMWKGSIAGGWRKLHSEGVLRYMRFSSLDDSDQIKDGCDM